MTREMPFGALLRDYERAMRSPESVADMQRAAREAAAERDRERVARWTDRLAAADAPSNAWYVARATDLDRPPQGVVRAVMAALEKRERQQPLLVVAASRPHSGRTLALTRAIAEWSGTSRFVRAADLVENTSRSYAAENQQRELLASMQGVSLLAVDDVCPDLSPVLYHDVLVRRFEEGRVTISVVASGDPQEWCRHYLTTRVVRYQTAGGLVIVGG